MRDSRLFDSHIHLNSKVLRDWFEVHHKEYKDWVFNNVSTDLEDFRVALEQSRRHENVFVTAGIHPLEVDNLDVDEVLKEMEESIGNGEKIIAIGETGFDFYRAEKEKCYESQKASFIKHFELARRHSLPLMLHIRAAHEETLELLEKLPPHFGIIHCFTGNLELAKRYLNLPGKWMISLSPIVFRDQKNYEKVVGGVDMDRLLVETDAPYLAENNMGVIGVMELIADGKNMDFGECRRILWGNFCSFFRLKL